MLTRITTTVLVFLLAATLQAQQYSLMVYADAKPGDSLYDAAKTFMTELNRSVNITPTFKPVSAFAKDGVVLLTRQQADANKTSYSSKLKALGPEGVYISSNSRSIKIVGNSALAVQEAIYIYLEQIGFRYLQPGENWIVVPALRSIYKSAEILVQPDYEYRTIANGHGYMNSAQIKSDFDYWYKANRMGGAFNISLGHIYDWIISQRPEEFKNHPEYFGEPPAKGTIPPIFKFNVANKNLVALIKEIMEKEMKKNVERNIYPRFISMEPSDGGGFCTSPECQKIGTPSDQVFYLVNEVAKIGQKYGMTVGSYAYSQHIAPTKYRLEPNVFVMVTNGFNWTKYSTTELLKMWGQKASRLGVYEYLSVYEGDMDMPGRHNASKPRYLQKTVRDFYNAGARSYQGESTIGWISRGPGQYILTRLLWNRNVNIDSVKNDFFTKAYEQSAPLMIKVYDSWEKNTFGVPRESDLADWHALIDEAYSKASNDKVKRRIEDVMIYMHYVTLYTELQKKKSDQTILPVLRYTHRNRNTGVFATVPAMVSLANYSGFPQYAYYANPGKQVWMDNNTPLSRAEIIKDFNADKVKFKKVEGLQKFDKSADFISLSNVTTLSRTKYPVSQHSFVGRTEYIIQIKKQSAENYFEIKSGYTAGLTKDLPVLIKVYKNAGLKEIDEDETPLLRFEQSKKLETERFSLASLKPGLYSLVVEDGLKMFNLQYSPSINHSIVASERTLQTTTVAGYNTFYFYVPPGTKRFTIMKVNMNLESPAGRKIETPINTAETLVVEVKPGETGIWKMYNQAAHFAIDGIPPYLGQDPATMLVPSYLKK